MLISKHLVTRPKTTTINNNLQIVKTTICQDKIVRTNKCLKHNWRSKNVIERNGLKNEQNKEEITDNVNKPENCNRLWTGKLLEEHKEPTTTIRLANLVSSVLLEHRTNNKSQDLKLSINRTLTSHKAAMVLLLVSFILLSNSNQAATTTILVNNRSNSNNNTSIIATTTAILTSTITAIGITTTTIIIKLAAMRHRSSKPITITTMQLLQMAIVSSNSVLSNRCICLVVLRPLASTSASELKPN